MAEQYRRRRSNSKQIASAIQIDQETPCGRATSSKWERIFVGAAGMAVELFIAAIALFLWIHAQPGAMRAVLYNIIFIAGVSSLLFNGNPLLRYDAYYMLADFLEIPNLGPRGLRYMGYLMQRYVLGIADAERPLTAPEEGAWFIIYSSASFACRIFIYFSIVFFKMIGEIVSL